MDRARSRPDGDVERVFRLGEPGYPRPLLQIYEPPARLHVRGELSLESEALSGVAVAIVGARDASAYGLSVARTLARGLAERGIAVVSGLARGIDGAAHRGALEGGGLTIAVVGGGTDVVYPHEHRELRKAVLRQGLVVGEWPSGTRPLAGHFPARNRLISGLSLGVVVVEATAKSGSLITAEHALEQGREVFAVPGPAGAPRSGGPHGLLKEGAKLVERVEDIMAELPDIARETQAAPAPRLPAPELALLRAIASGNASIDAMVARVGRKIEEIWVDLLDLEMRGLVRKGPGGLYHVTGPQGPAVGVPGKGPRGGRG